MPLALGVAGGALVNKSIHVWENMISKLHSQQNHGEEIHKILETSYNCLGDPIAKYIFLICCSCKEDEMIPIETLYRYTMSLQLFKGDLEHIRNQVYTLVDDLITRNLLINVEIVDEKKRIFEVHYRVWDEHEPMVKVHDVVRDVGLSIAKQENDFNFLMCDGINELEDDLVLPNKAISIYLKPGLNFPADRIKLEGSKLELLRLYNGTHEIISRNFFGGANHLKVIDIPGGWGMINDFLNSFSFPFKLKMLSLEGAVNLYKATPSSFIQYLSCLDGAVNLYKATPASFIQHLSCLETLSLRGSDCKVLPNEVGELKTLKVLDLAFCECFINNGILSRLTNLQELYLWAGFQDWKAQNEDILSTTSRDNNAAELIELNCLQKLWRLELMVKNGKQLPRDVGPFSSSGLLKQFKISIGCAELFRYRWNKIEYNFESGERQLWLENINEDNVNLFHVIGALKGVTNLYISNNSSTWEKMCLNSFLSSLKEIVLRQCDSAITLFTPLQSLSQISHMEMEIKEFERYLRRIEIYECNQMRHLCSISKSMHLKNLQILTLERCETMEEVVHTYNNNTGQPQKIEFNALETLKLCDLPKLKYFCKEINEIQFLRLTILKLRGLKQFTFPSKIEIPHLKELEIISMPNITNLYPILSSSLQKLRIDDCHDIKYVFCNSFLKNIPRLEELAIRNCTMLYGIIGISSYTEDQTKKSIEFPKLRKLKLQSLDKLASFVIQVKNLDNEEKEDGNEEKKQHNSLFHLDDDDQVSFPCLEKLTTSGLSKISHIVGRGKHRDKEKKHQEPISLSLFPKLKRLGLRGLSNLIHLHESNHPELGEVLFQNVKSLEIGYCDKVRYLFTENIGRVGLKQLEELHISNCPMMEVVMKNEVEKDGNDDNKARGSEAEGIVSVSNTHFLPLLRELKLESLPCLRSFGDVGYTWTLPSISWLFVQTCPKLEAFSPGYLGFPKLNFFRYNRRVRNLENWNGDINTLLHD